MPERIIPGTKWWERQGGAHISRYEFALPYTKNKKVLDVGCGAGYGSYYLAANGAKSVLGIDFSKKAIKFAGRHYSCGNLSFGALDAVLLPELNQKFDVIVCFEVIEHLVDYDKFLEGVYNVLLEGGILVISTPNKDKFCAKDNLYHYHEFSPSELKNLLESKFQKVALYGQVPKTSYMNSQEEPVKNRGTESAFIEQWIKNPLLTVLYFLGIFKHKQLKSSDFQFVTGSFESKALNLVAVCEKNG